VNQFTVRKKSALKRRGRTLSQGQDANPNRCCQQRQPYVLFLLDEFAALGRLEPVERAMGLMAGYGVQLWPILQDLHQLRGSYGTRAGTFLVSDTASSKLPTRVAWLVARPCKAEHHSYVSKVACGVLCIIGIDLVVLDPAEVAQIVVPDGRPRTIIAIRLPDRRVSADLNAKSVRKAVAAIGEHGPDGVAVVVQGKLVGDTITEAGACRLRRPIKAPTA
jgi:hypothetical protein